MITINNKKYKDYITKISWGKFSSNISGVKEEGLAPIIKYIIDNKIVIELELVYSEDKFKTLEINKKTDFYKYVVGVAYEDKSGWMPIYDYSLNIYLTRKNKEYFNIDFKVIYDDLDEKIIIKINDDLKLL